nr:HAD-IB family hydrolase [uncultured Corynebacterium sp.]
MLADRYPLSERASNLETVSTQSTIRSRVRAFLSRRVFPTRGESAQVQAGEAAVQHALQSLGGSNYSAGVAEVASETQSTQWQALNPDAPNDPNREAINQLARKLDVPDAALRDGLRNLHGASQAAGGVNKLNDPDPSIPQDVGAAAFFDVDNTLIKGASILLFARGLVKRKFFGVGEVLGFVWKQLRFRLSGENQGDIDQGREQALALVKGHKVSELVSMAEEIWAASISERIFPGTKELADMHLQAGHQVWLVTAAPVQLAQIIARELGFTGALGTVAEVEDGTFTGRMVGDMLHGPGKQHAVVALSAYEGLDLARCTAYSDSINDIPMLSKVGTAVAVNPDTQLRKAAQRNGWEIRDYRRSRKVVRAGGTAAAAGVAAAGGYWILRK